MVLRVSETLKTHILIFNLDVLPCVPISPNVSLPQEMNNGRPASAILDHSPIAILANENMRGDVKLEENLFGQSDSDR